MFYFSAGPQIKVQPSLVKDQSYYICFCEKSRVNGFVKIPIEIGRRTKKKIIIVRMVFSLSILDALTPTSL
jgi:hypothetical protein